MDRLDAMSLFVCVVNEGSLAAAARRLGLSPASVSRAVSTLEDRLGAKLLHRTPRSLKLTEAGATYADACRRVLGLLDEAETNLAADRETPHGVLTLEAPFVIGSVLLRPLLDRFLDRHAGMSGRLRLTLDRPSDLIGDDIDVALRIGELPPSNLVATRIGELRWIVCAAPSYLASRGHPATPSALAEHRCISSVDGVGGEHWRFRSDDEHVRPVNVRPFLTVSGQLAAIDSALEGRGIARVMSFSVHRHVEEGALVPLLAEVAPPPGPVHLVMTEAARKTAKVRAFIDFAAAPLRASLRLV